MTLNFITSTGKMGLVDYSSSEEEEEKVLSVAKIDVAPLVSVKAPEATEIVKDIRNAAGIIEFRHYDDYTFEQQSKYGKRDGDDIRSTKYESRQIKKRRVKKGKTDIIDGDSAYLGPWAKYKDSSDEEEDDKEPEDSDKERETEEELEESDSDAEPEESTEFYGENELDYQGRPYTYIPTDLKLITPKECFAPKKQIHKWKGHLKGTTKIELFPKSQHLLLSCGNDSKIYLWSNYAQRELLRGYFGHDKPIRDISFNSDGSKFLSASYDKNVKLWDTASGECLWKIKLKAVPNVVKFNIWDDNEFLVGLTNHKIEHYNTKGELLQTYDHHLGSINYLCFITGQEENVRRFISTSEDKTIRVWDINFNIPIKLISDPTLHSMPFLKVHPSGKYFAAQSMDNTILVFSTKDRFKTNKKKLFSGHNCAGFGISIDFSPDGKNLISGDSSGHLCVWDWKTCKLVKKLKIDSKPTTHVAWNQLEVSKVVASGVSGGIFYYD